MDTSVGIILFTYDISVFGRKVEWYLILRGIKYTKCAVRNRLPREQLEELGINYRRIPILGIGRDVYCDTRIIVDKLEQLFPANRLGSSQPFERAIEYLVENWVNDAGPFWRTALLIPPIAEVMNDAEWIKDRTEMTGNPFNKDILAALRPDGLVHHRMYWSFLEEKLLGDGRLYILGGEKPSLADVHGLWVWDWVLQEKMNMIDFLEQDLISQKIYPKTVGWVKRFREYVKMVQQKDGEAPTLSNQDAIRRILDSDFTEPEGTMDEQDPLGLKKGQVVEVWPTDSGQALAHHDKGELVSIGIKEVVIRSEVPNGKGHLRLHFPRNNFKIQQVQQSKL